MYLRNGSYFSEAVNHCIQGNCIILAIYIVHKQLLIFQVPPSHLEDFYSKDYKHMINSIWKSTWKNLEVQKILLSLFY